MKESTTSHIELSQIIKFIDKDPSILASYSAKLKDMVKDACENIIKLIL